MDEKELIDGLRGLTLAEPELGFDPDDVAGRAAKRQRTRRAILGATAGTLAIVGMAVGTFVYTNAAAGLPVEPGVVSTTAPPTSARAVPGTTPRADKPDMTRQVAAIQAHLEQKLPGLVPGATDLRITVEQAYDREFVMAVVEYRDSTGPAGFNVSVLGRRTAGMMSFREKCDCQPVPQPDQSTVYLDRRGQPGAGRPANRDAAHYRADGSIVSIVHGTHYSSQQAERAGLTDGAGQGVPGFRPTFPLTDQQIIALITDPALTAQ